MAVSNKSKTKSGRTSPRRKNSSKKNIRRDEMSAVDRSVVFCVGLGLLVLLCLSNFGLAGTVGEGIKWFIFGLIGCMGYVLPFLIAFNLFYISLKKRIEGGIRIKFVFAYLLLWMIAGLWQRLYNMPDISTSSLGDIFTFCANAQNGGGFLGGLLCFMLSPTGAVFTTIILIILIALFIIIISEGEIIKRLRDSGTKAATTVRSDIDDYRENMAIHDEQRKERIERMRRERDLREEEKARRQASVSPITSGVGGHSFDIKANDKHDDIEVKEITPNETKISDDEELFFGNRRDFNENEVKKTSKSSDDMIRDGLLNETVTDTGDKEIDEINEVEQESTLIEPVTPVCTESISETPNKEERVKGNELYSKKESEQIVPVPNAEDTEFSDYKYPPIDLLSAPKSRGRNDNDSNVKTAERLKQTLATFGVNVTVTDISCGPSVTRYEIQPEMGVKVSKIVSLADDIKLNLAASDIRIEAPIPGKAAIGIEVPNKEARGVTLRELIETSEFRSNKSLIAFAVGEDIAGKPVMSDIAKMPHLLIAGATGSGKSVCINALIMSVLYKARPDEVKMIMVDPKVVELSAYNGIPHLLIPVVTDPKKAAGALNWAVMEMEKRYKLFAAVGAKNLADYNKKIMSDEYGEEYKKMPQLLIIIDELADLMMVAASEVETAICRLAQLARAAGIHLVIATQRPSVNVITGLIKANVPSRIAFSVSSGVDSRTILDMNGAEKLLGKGDMLYFPTGKPKPERIQGAFVSDDEVARVVDFLKENNISEDTDNVSESSSVNNVDGEISSLSESLIISDQSRERDSLFEEAGRFVIEKERASIGMLQRNFRIGFNRAGRIVDQLSEAGVVGPEIGTKPRKVLMTEEEFEEYLKRQ